MSGKFAIQELTGNPAKWFRLRGEYDTAEDAEAVRGRIGRLRTRVVQITPKGLKPVKLSDDK